MVLGFYLWVWKWNRQNTWMGIWWSSSTDSNTIYCLFPKKTNGVEIKHLHTNGKKKSSFYEMFFYTSSRCPKYTSSNTMKFYLFITSHLLINVKVVVYLIGIFNKLSCINTSTFNILLRIYRHFFREDSFRKERKRRKRKRREKKSQFSCKFSLVFKAIYKTMKNPKKLETWKQPIKGVVE